MISPPPNFLQMDRRDTESARRLQPVVDRRPKTYSFHVLEENVKHRLFFAEQMAAASQINITYQGQQVLSIGLDYSRYAEAINESKYLLDLPDNFDEEGSKAYEFVTWKKSCAFLLEYAKYCRSKTGLIPPAPSIYHGPDGSIDIHWTETEFRLLINITEGDGLSTFFGRTPSDQNSKGVFDVGACKFELLPLIPIV